MIKENIANRDKAARLLAALQDMHMSMFTKQVEDIEYGCTSKQLDFYYFWICEGGKR